MSLRQPPSNSPFPEIRLRFRGGVLCVAVPGMPDPDEAAAAYRDPRAPAGTEGRPGSRGRAGRTTAPPTTCEARDAAGEFQGTTVRTAIRLEADKEPLYQPGLGLLGQLLREAARARRRIEVTIPPAIGRRNAAHAALERALDSPFRRLKTKRLAALDAAFNAAVEEVRGLTARLAACRVPIRTEFDQGTTRDAFVALADAHDGLCRTGRIWELRPGAGQDARGRRAEGLDPGAAAEAIAAGGGARVPVSFGPARTGLVATALPGVRLTDAEGGALDLFEGFCLLHGPKPHGPDRAETGAPDPVVLDFRDLRVEASAVQLIEDGRVPADAADAVVGHTWARLREDGSPDLHHPGNRRLPVLRYGLLSVRGPEGIDQTYVVSREAAAAGFARAVAQMQAALDALARRSVSSGAPPEPEPERDPFPQHAGPQRYTPQLKPEPRRDPFLLRGLQHHALPPEPPSEERQSTVASPRAVPPRTTEPAEAGPVARPDRRRRDRATSAAVARRRRRSGRAVLWWGAAAVAMAVLVAIAPGLMEQWRVDAPSAIAPPPERPPPEPVTQAVPIEPPHPGAAPPGSTAPERRADDAPGSTPTAPEPAAGSPAVTPSSSPAADVALLPLPPDPPPSPPPLQNQATGASALPMPRPPPPPPPAPPEASAQAAQQPPAPASAPVQAAVPGSRIAMAQGANVRAAPGGGAPVLRTVNSGTRVLIFARQGNWLQIGDGDQPWGWVHTSRAERGG